VSARSDGYQMICSAMWYGQIDKYSRLYTGTYRGCGLVQRFLSSYHKHIVFPKIYETQKTLCAPWSKISIAAALVSVGRRSLRNIYSQWVFVLYLYAHIICTVQQNSRHNRSLLPNRPWEKLTTVAVNKEHNNIVFIGFPQRSSRAHTF